MVGFEGLEVGVGILSWLDVVGPLCYSVDILLFSLRLVGSFLGLLFIWYLGCDSLLYYAFVVGYWLCLIESWLLIRSAYCC